MKRKLAMALATVMAVASLAGCGTSNQAGSAAASSAASEAVEAASSTASSAASAAASETAEPAASDSSAASTAASSAADGENSYASDLHVAPQTKDHLKVMNIPVTINTYYTLILDGIQEEMEKWGVDNFDYAEMAPQNEDTPGTIS